MSRYLNEKNNIEKLRITLDFYLNYNDEPFNFDKFIIDVFEEYCNLNNTKIPDYIKEKDRLELTKNVVYRIKERMSKELYDYLKYNYNEDSIDEVIVEKVTLLTLDYTIKHNIN